MKTSSKSSPQQSKSTLAEAMKATRRTFIFVGVFSAAINLLFLTQPFYMMQMFDRVLPSRSFDTLVFLTVIAFTGIALLAFLDFLRQRLLARVNSFLDQALAPEAFERAISNTLRGKTYGTEALRDLNAVRGFLSSPGVTAIFDAPWTPLYLIVIFMVHPVLGAFAAGGALLMLVIAFTNEIATRAPLRESGLAQMRAMRRVESTGRNAEAVSAMGMLPNLARLWATDNLDVNQHQETASNRTAAVMALTKFVRLLLQLGILASGGWLVVQQELTAGAMVSASLIFGRALAPVEQALGAWRGFVVARAAYDRVRQFFAEAAPGAEGMTLPDPTGVLQVERVTYAIPGTDRLIVKGVSFEVKPGQALAMLGPSGAGKSTLARLMVGLLRPTAGNVRLDSADVWLWNRNDLGRSIGFVPQNVELFAGTIAQNIARMGDPDKLDSKEVVRAAEIAGVHELVLRMPKGYDTDIGESGALISAGQRQRIALARAIYGRPRFFVLDEPNSNLDFEGEEALVRAVQHLKEEGCSIVLITHRPSLVECVDRVVVLRDGVVMLSGERTAVLERMRINDAQRLAATAPPAVPPPDAPSPPPRRLRQVKAL